MKTRRWATCLAVALSIPGAQPAHAASAQQSCTMPLRQNSFQAVRVDLPRYGEIFPGWPSDDLELNLDVAAAGDDLVAGIFLVHPETLKVLRSKIEVRAVPARRIIVSDTDEPLPPGPLGGYKATTEDQNNPWLQSVYAVSFSVGARPGPQASATVDMPYTCSPMAIEGDLMRLDELDFEPGEGGAGRTHAYVAGKADDLRATFDVERDLFFGAAFVNARAGDASLKVKGPGWTNFVEIDAWEATPITSSRGRWDARLTYQAVEPAAAIAGITLDLPRLCDPGPVVSGPTGGIVNLHTPPPQALVMSGSGRYLGVWLPGPNFPIPQILDRSSGQLTRVDISTDGDPDSRYTYFGDVAEGGRYAAISTAWWDPQTYISWERAYRFDAQTNQLTLISQSSQGQEAQQPDRVGFPSGENVATGISDDGRYVLLWSSASNLVPGDTNGTFDLFVRDVQAGTTTRVSMRPDGTEDPRGSGHGVMTPDGRFVVYPLHSSSGYRLIRFDRATGERVVVADRIADWRPTSMSDDGRIIVYRHWDSITEPIRVYAANVETGTISLVSANDQGEPANLDSYEGSVSGNGRYVAFHSYGTNLVTDDRNAVGDVFIRDLLYGTTVRASLDSQNRELDSMSRYPQLSRDGSTLSFYTYACRLTGQGQPRGGGYFLRDLSLN